jgi:serine/threonine protein kinase
MELTTGLLFADRYKFIKQLGRGGFAEVWLAEDNLTGVQVAVKVYAPGTGLDENGIKIFTQEFSVVFDMNHTNLLRPTHYDCYERMPYLIMPYIKNGSTFKYIAEGQSIPEDECWKMLHDVASGLAYLHEKMPPLIHQDIKPDNIMIDDEGRYLITDFGISARVRSTIRGSQAQEQSGGTLAYMGPERFGPTPKPIMASDVWSMGAMMYELMTGTPPFGNHGGILQKNGADIPLIENNYSQELKDIIYACLAKEPWDRPSAKKIEEQTYNKLHGIVTPVEKPEEKPNAPIIKEAVTEKPVWRSLQLKSQDNQSP